MHNGLKSEGVVIYHCGLLRASRFLHSPDNGFWACLGDFPQDILGLTETWVSLCNLTLSSPSGILKRSLVAAPGLHSGLCSLQLQLITGRSNSSTDKAMSVNCHQLYGGIYGGIYKCPRCHPCCVNLPGLLLDL